MSEAATASFLTTVPLLEGIAEEELEELARVMRPRDLPAGRVLWREGEKAEGMLVIAEGLVSVTLRLPGERTVELSTLGPGDLLGEIPLLDGGRHAATARVVEPARVLSLTRADFAALVSRGHPTAFALKRSIARHTCSRLRFQFEALSRKLGAEESSGPPPEAPPVLEDLEFCEPPDSRYIGRLGILREFDSLALWGFLTAGRYARCPAGSTLVAEGQPSNACYLTINGAVEKVIVRGGRRIRVGLAGPGQAFGYESLIDGGPSPVTATARERALLLVLPQEQFERLFSGETSGSHVFLDVIHRDLVAALRQALRPHARLAASV